MGEVLLALPSCGMLRHTAAKYDATCRAVSRDNGSSVNAALLAQHLINPRFSTASDWLGSIAFADHVVNRCKPRQNASVDSFVLHWETELKATVASTWLVTWLRFTANGLTKVKTSAYECVIADWHSCWLRDDDGRFSCCRQRRLRCLLFWVDIQIAAADNVTSRFQDKQSPL